MSPRAKPSQPKCQTNPTSWTVWSSSLNGRTRSVTNALTSTSPRKSRDRDPVKVTDPQRVGEFGGDFGKRFLLQLGGDRYRARRHAARMVVGQPICRQRIRKARVVRGVQPVVGTLPDFGNGTALLAIERVLDRRFHRLAVRLDRRVLPSRWG